MDRNSKNILARALLVFAIVFAVVFIFLERSSDVWEARSTVVIFPQKGSAPEQGYGFVPAENAYVLASSNSFKKRLDKRLKGEDIAYTPYTLEVSMGEGSSIEMTVSIASMDPLVAKDISESAVEELFSVMAKYYDVSKEVTLKPVSVGEVYKQTSAKKNYVWAFVWSALAVAFVETFARLGQAPKRQEPFPLPETVSKDKRWWKENLESKHEFGTASDELDEEPEESSESEEEKDEQKEDAAQVETDQKFIERNQKEESHGAIEIHGTIPRHEEDSHLISEGLRFVPKNRHPIPMVPTQKSVDTARKLGAAPSNLPVVSLEDLNYLKNPNTMNDESTSYDSRDADKKFDRGPEKIAPEPEVTEEPTEEEMKERLNKLLRGEL